MINATGRPIHKLLAGVLATLSLVGIAATARKPAQPQLSAHGLKLQAQYQARMDALRKEIIANLPKMDPKEKAAYLAARKSTSEAKAKFYEARVNLGKFTDAKRLLDEAKSKLLDRADHGIAAADKKLANAKTDAEREAAKAELAKWKKKREAGVETLNARRAAWEKLKSQGPQLTAAFNAAKEAFDKAQARVTKAAAAINKKLPESDALDGKLAEYVILLQATPAGLASFAAKGDKEKALVDQLLNDEDLMIQMLTAGGAKGGKYGEAMKIYADIQKASERSRKKGILQNLALGTSLELTVPYKQRYGTFLSRGRPAVDPVKRYLHYEKAFLAGELDPAFKDMSVWECRWIASDPSSDEELKWLRTALRNYRPDLLANPDPRWYYSRIIKTDVRYTRPKWDNTRPVTERVPQAVDKGGICHIRAWVARSAVRSFGIPVRRVEQGGAKLKPSGK